MDIVILSELPLQALTWIKEFPPSPVHMQGVGKGPAHEDSMRRDKDKRDDSMWNTVKLVVLGLVALFAAIAANYGRDLSYQVHAVIIMFVAAGLYPHEQRYVYVFLPFSLVLFLGGILFCFYLVFPFVLTFLLGFNDWLGVTPQIRLSEWISFAVMLPLLFGVSFQLPLVMLFLDRLSIFNADIYRTKRRVAILVISIVSMMLTPADPASMVMMMFPLILLYELGIWLCQYMAHRNPFEPATI